MSRQIQLRRGTADEHNAFTGAPGEVTYDTTNKTLHVHDGATPGGTQLAKRNELPITTDIIHAMMPDYSNYIELQSGMHTAAYDGWLIVDISSESGESGWVIEIDNMILRFGQGYSGTDYTHATNGVLPIARGTVFRLELRNGVRIRFFSCMNDK